MPMAVSFKPECESGMHPALAPQAMACTRGFAGMSPLSRPAALLVRTAASAEPVMDERFSCLYLRPSEPTPDSARARYRIAALFREEGFSEHAAALAAYVGREVGIPQFADSRHSSQWNQFVRECRIGDLLDTITVIYRYLFWHVGEQSAHWWRDAVRRIFSEEKLAYRLDDIGGVHPAVDQEFQRNISSVIAGMQAPRYQKVAQLLESAATHLLADPANYKQAWRATLAAVEGLFGMMFPYVRMTADEMDRHLLPMVQNAYAGDASAHTAARAMVNSLQTWVEAAHAYRHEPGADDPPQPPADVAILAISGGASFVRWLIALNDSRASD